MQHAKYWLDVTQHELYLSFLNLNSNIKIDQAMFERFEPYFVNINRYFETFCCWYHVEFIMNYDVVQGRRIPKGDVLAPSNNHIAQTQHKITKM